MQRQVKLPFLKSVEISIKSIKVRFFRSLITTMSLVLAVSFLSFVGVSNDIANGMLAKQDPELRQQLFGHVDRDGEADADIDAGLGKNR